MRNTDSWGHGALSRSPIRHFVPAVLAILLAACGSQASQDQPAVGADKKAPTQSELTSFASGQGTASEPDMRAGKTLFDANCAACHDGGEPRAPHRQFLKMMAPDAIVRALTDGIMRQQGSALKVDERRQLAAYLTGADLAKWRPAPPPLVCKGDAARFDLTRPPPQVGWGYDTRRFTPAAAAGLSATDVPRLKLKWAFAFPSSLRARSQPVAAMGAIFVGSQDGTVYAFDMDSGCARWTSRVSAEVRTAIVVAPWAAGRAPAAHPRLFFGDLLGRVYAMDALTGKLLWRIRPENHPNATITGTPLLHGDTLYVPISSLEVTNPVDPKYACCTFRGVVAALDTATGRVKWKHYTVEHPATEVGKTAVGTAILGPSGAPVWTSPTLDLRRGVIYHGSGENYSSPADGNSDTIFAVDMKTGKRRWSHQLLAGDAWNGTCLMPGHPNCPVQRGPDFDLAASVLLIDIGGGKQTLIAAPKSGIVTAVDPDANGRQVWQTKVGRGSMQGGVHFGMAAEGTRIYVPITDMKLSAHGVTINEPGHAGLHALDVRTGKILWSTLTPDTCHGREFCDPGISSAVTAMPGVVFAGSMDGRLRAYDGATGRIIWTVDTMLPVKGTNGETATGGSMSGPGPLIANGHVVVNSGYGFSFHTPGNAFLVYTVDGK